MGEEGFSPCITSSPHFFPPISLLSSSLHSPPISLSPPPLPPSTPSPSLHPLSLPLYSLSPFLSSPPPLPPHRTVIQATGHWKWPSLDSTSSFRPPGSPKTCRSGRLDQTTNGERRDWGLSGQGTAVKLGWGYQASFYKTGGTRLHPIRLGVPGFIL